MNPEEMKKYSKVVNFYNKASRLFDVSNRNFFGVTEDNKIAVAGYATYKYDDIRWWPHIKSIQYYYDGLMAVSESNELYVNGFFDPEEYEMEHMSIALSTEDKVVKIVPGNRYVLVVYQDGTVKSFGCERYAERLNKAKESGDKIVQAVSIGGQSGYVLGGLSGKAYLIEPFASSRIYTDVETWDNGWRLYGETSGLVYLLKEDGTVCSAGSKQNYRTRGVINSGYDMGDTDSWSDIIDIGQGSHLSFGVRKDGTICCTSYDDSWVTLFDHRDIALKNKEYQRKQYLNGLKETIKNIKDVIKVVVFSDDFVVIHRNGTVEYFPTPDENGLIRKRQAQNIEELRTWKNVIAVKMMDQDVIIGLTIDGKLLQPSWSKSLPEDSAHPSRGSFNFDLSKIRMKDLSLSALSSALSFIRSNDGIGAEELLLTLGTIENADEIYRLWKAGESIQAIEQYICHRIENDFIEASTIEGYSLTEKFEYYRYLQKKLDIMPDCPDAVNLSSKIAADFAKKTTDDSRDTIEDFRLIQLRMQEKALSDRYNLLVSESEHLGMFAFSKKKANENERYHISCEKARIRKQIAELEKAGQQDDKNGQEYWQKACLFINAGTGKEYTEYSTALVKKACKGDLSACECGGLVCENKRIKNRIYQEHKKELDRIFSKTEDDSDELAINCLWLHYGCFTDRSKYGMILLRSMNNPIAEKFRMVMGIKKEED